MPGTERGHAPAVPWSDAQDEEFQRRFHGHEAPLRHRADEEPPQEAPQEPPQEGASTFEGVLSQMEATSREAARITLAKAYVLSLGAFVQTAHVRGETFAEHFYDVERRLLEQQAGQEAAVGQEELLGLASVGEEAGQEAAVGQEAAAVGQEEPEREMDTQAEWRIDYPNLGPAVEETHREASADLLGLASDPAVDVRPAAFQDVRLTAGYVPPAQNRLLEQQAGHQEADQVGEEAAVGQEAGQEAAVGQEAARLLHQEALEGVFEQVQREASLFQVPPMPGTQAVPPPVDEEVLDEEVPPPVDEEVPPLVDEEVPVSAAQPIAAGPAWAEAPEAPRQIPGRAVFDRAQPALLGETSSSEDNPWDELWEPPVPLEEEEPPLGPPEGATVDGYIVKRLTPEMQAKQVQEANAMLATSKNVALAPGVTAPVVKNPTPAMLAKSQNVASAPVDGPPKPPPECCRMLLPPKPPPVKKAGPEAGPYRAWHCAKCQRQWDMPGACETVRRDGQCSGCSAPVQEGRLPGSSVQEAEETWPEAGPYGHCAKCQRMWELPDACYTVRQGQCTGCSGPVQEGRIPGSTVQEAAPLQESAGQPLRAIKTGPWAQWQGVGGNYGAVGDDIGRASRRSMSYDRPRQPPKRQPQDKYAVGDDGLPLAWNLGWCGPKPDFMLQTSPYVKAQQAHQAQMDQAKANALVKAQQAHRALCEATALVEDTAQMVEARERRWEPVPLDAPSQARGPARVKTPPLGAHKSPPRGQEPPSPPRERPPDGVITYVGPAPRHPPSSSGGPKPPTVVVGGSSSSGPRPPKDPPTQPPTEPQADRCEAAARTKW